MKEEILWKNDEFLKMLEAGSVFVHLDPRREGVDVPADLRARARIVLQVRRDATRPPPDIEADGDGVRCTLAFGGVPHRCVIPWSAVYGLVGDDGAFTLWSMELPRELVHPDVLARAESSSPRGGRASILPARGGSKAPRIPEGTRALSMPPIAGNGSGGSRRPGTRPSLLAALERAPLIVPRPPALPRVEIPSIGVEPDSAPATAQRSRTERANDGASIPAPGGGATRSGAPARRASKRAPKK